MHRRLVDQSIISQMTRPLAVSTKHFVGEMSSGKMVPYQKKWSQTHFWEQQCKGEEQNSRSKQTRVWVRKFRTENERASVLFFKDNQGRLLGSSYDNKS